MARRTVKAQELEDVIIDDRGTNIPPLFRSGVKGVVQDIGWISSLPGAGKTQYAVQTMVKAIQGGKRLVIYAAPTHKLIKEVGAKIRKKLDPKDHGRVRIVDQELQSMFTTDDQYRTMKSLVRALVQGGTFLNDSKILPIEPGSVILMTHETFLRLDSGYDEEGRSRFPKRGKIHVLFDEAQKCVLQSERISLPLDLVSALEPYLSLSSLVDVQGPSVLNFNPRATMDRVIRDIWKKGGEASRATKRSLAVLDRILAHVHEANIKVMARARLVDNGPDKSMDLVLQTVLDPARSFYGWKSVTLMAARLENSQMFHMLSRSSVDRLPYEDPKTYERRTRFMIECSLRLVPVQVPSVVKRERLVKDAWSRTHMTYVCGGQSELSKTALDSAVVAALPEDWSMDLWTHELRKLMDQAEGGYKMNTKARVLIDYARSSTRLNHKVTDLSVSSVDQAVINHIRTLPDLKSLTPIQYMVQRATVLNRMWSKVHGDMTPSPLPITINVGSKRIRPEGQYRAEVDQAGLVEGQNGDWVQVPFKSQGLNSFRHHNVMAFLASINPTPEVKDLLGMLCPAYNSKLDHVVDQAVQSLARGSIRLPKVVAPRLLILPDKATAQLVHEAGFLGLPKLIEPSAIADLGPGLTKKEKRELQSVHSLAFLNFRRTKVKNAEQMETSKARSQGRQNKRTARERFLAEEIELYSEYLSLTRRLKRVPAKATESKIRKLEALTLRLDEIKTKVEADIKLVNARFNQKWADGDFGPDLKGL